MSTATLTGPPSSSWTASERTLLIAVCAAHALSHLHMQVFPPLYPLLRTELGATFVELGLFATTYSIVSALTQAPVGFLVDRIGPRRVLAGGLILGGLAYAGFAAVGTYAAMITAGVVLGLANAVYHPADYALLNGGIAGPRMGRAFSLHTFAGYAGGALAPLAIIGLAAAIGSRGAVLCAGAMGFAAAAFLWHACPRDAQPRKRQAGTGPKPRLLNRAILGLTGFFVLIALSFSGTNSWAVAALNQGHGLSLAMASAALTAYMVGSAGGTLIGGALADRTQRHGLVAGLGFGLSALCTLAVAALPMPGVAVALVLGISGIAAGLCMPSRDMMVRAAAPPGQAGAAFGIVSTGFNVGGMLAPPLFGALMDAGRPEAVFYLGAGFMALTALAAVVPELRKR